MPEDKTNIPFEDSMNKFAHDHMVNNAREILKDELAVKDARIAELEAIVEMTGEALRTYVASPENTPGRKSILLRNLLELYYPPAPAGGKKEGEEKK